MDKLFLTILNMSLTGAFVIIAICIARLPLKKAPKIISYWLWAVAGFRLIIPFSIESAISLIPFKSTPIPHDLAIQAVPRIDIGIPAINNTISSVLPAATPTASANPLQMWTMIGAYVWLAGIVIMLVYGVASYIILKRKMRTAIQKEDNIYETGNIRSPFVLGIIKPNIYLPLDLSDREREYIILHERTHISRYDHISKIAAYLVLSIHWFNPLAWVAFILMGADMEMACDERVLKKVGIETKKDYSLSLLSLAANKRFIGGSPLAFSEGGLKTRIMNVLKYKKTSMVIVIIAVALTTALSVGLALNREDSDVDDHDDNLQEEVRPLDIEFITEVQTDATDEDINEKPVESTDAISLFICGGECDASYVATVEEANSLLPFRVELPSELPEDARLNGIWVHNEGDGQIEYGATLNYSLKAEYPTRAHLTNIPPPHMSILQGDIGASALEEFEMRYNLFPDIIIESSGRRYESIQTMVGDSRAILSSNVMSALLGLEASEDEDVMCVILTWYKDDKLYQTHFFAPVDFIDLDGILAIADSLY